MIAGKDTKEVLTGILNTIEALNNSVHDLQKRVADLEYHQKLAQLNNDAEAAK